MTYEENETIVVYDYAKDTVFFYTTRKGEVRNLRKRLGEENLDVTVKKNDNCDVAWEVLIDMENCRDAYMVTPVLN